MTRKTIIVSLTASLFVAVSALLVYFLFFANSNSAELDPAWSGEVADSTLQVDHSEWQLLLDDYLVTDTESAVHLFDYSGLLDDGREVLDQYVSDMVSVDPLLLNRSEQKAFWINLYNAVTVQLIVDNFPLTTITSLGSGGVTKFGPWDDKLVEINNRPLSLNDIEHRIIRPLYNDHRIHFAVNCASIGCPNLAADAFIADELDEQLDSAAAAYMNHPRGLSFENGKLHLSTLFDWYADDFGNDQSAVLSTLANYVDDAVRQQLSSYTGKISYAYDWSLNGYCSEDNTCGD